MGDELFTTLTPLTFRKAGFNGVVTSIADRFRVTGLFSRISSPIIDIEDRFSYPIIGKCDQLNGMRVLLKRILMTI